MPVASSYPKFEVPTVDIWAFLFEKKDREFPDSKGKLESFGFQQFPNT
jgi:4-coumarate--CoA ligase